MAGEYRESHTTARRRFLLEVSSAAAASAVVVERVARAEDKPPAEEAEPLPMIRLGEHRVTRLIAGWNPIGGHSHTTLNMARHMREYFTDERTVQFIADCRQAGINAWQISHGEKAVRVVRGMRERGLDVKLICLHAEKGLRAKTETAINDTKPIAMVHHGGVTDALFRAGKGQKVRDYVKKVHDHGILAGVSAHNPDNIKRIADEGWEVDLFMACVYYVTRPREEQQKLLGTVTVGEPFLESDPADMTKVIRQVEQPCLTFKILAAGRLGWSKYSAKKAFKLAFENIKPIDGVIVGMYPKYHDEISDNADYTRQFGAVR